VGALRAAQLAGAAMSAPKARTLPPERAARAAICSQTAAGTGDAAMASVSATRDGQGQNAPFGRAQTASRVRIAPASVLKTRTAPPETNSARRAVT
jgi:hypothetical protein